MAISSSWSTALLLCPVWLTDHTDHNAATCGSLLPEVGTECCAQPKLISEISSGEPRDQLPSNLSH